MHCNIPNHGQYAPVPQLTPTPAPTPGPNGLTPVINPQVIVGTGTGQFSGGNVPNGQLITPGSGYTYGNFTRK
jgi:hypothetical protein